jgi:hypothetical protein
VEVIFKWEFVLAGNQLKLQLESQDDSNNSNSGVAPKSPLKSIGPLLMFQPETGSLSLNMSVTKNLFQALGGKLVVRQRSKTRKSDDNLFALKKLRYGATRCH